MGCQAAVPRLGRVMAMMGGRSLALTSTALSMFWDFAPASRPKCRPPSANSWCCSSKTAPTVNVRAHEARLGAC